MLTAVGGFQRLHPLSDVVIFHRRESLEVSADNGSETHRRRIISNLPDRRRQVYHRIVLRRLRSMPRNSSRDHGNVKSHLFIRLYANVLRFSILHENVAAFVDREACREFVPMLRNQHADAGVAAAFFVIRGQKNYVAVQPGHRTLQRNEHRQVRRHHALVVDRSAPVQIPILNHGAERVHAPSPLLHWNGVQMRYQQEGLRGIGHRRAPQPRHYRAPSRRHIQNFRLDAILGQHS